MHQSIPRASAKSANNSRVVSPFSRKPSLSRSTTPTPTAAGLSLSKGFIEDANKTNDLLNQELLKLHSEVSQSYLLT